jgi:outer membrane protein
MKALLALAWAAGGLLVRPATAQPGAAAPPAETNAPNLSLEEAYERTLATDQSLAIAIKEIEKAKLLPWAAVSTVGPRLTANGSAYHPERDLHGENGPIRVDTTRGDLTLQQPLFDPQVFAALRSARLSVEGSRLAYKSAARSVLFGTSRAFYDVLKQQRVDEVNRETLQLAREQLALAERRFQVGVAVKTDMLRARVQVEQANRLVTESENALAFARTVLANVLNLRDRTLVPREPAPVPARGEPVEDLLRRAFERREDYQAGDVAIRQSEENHKVAKADWGPRVTGQVSYQMIDPETQSQPNEFWDAIVAVQLPILNGGKRSVEIRRTAFDIAEAKLRQEDLEKAIDQDVRQAWLLVRALQESLTAVRAQVEAAAENYKDLQSQYRAGTATSLDVMTALNDLNSARRDLATQSYDFEVALLNLDRATGTFQDPLVEKLTPP